MEILPKKKKKKEMESFFEEKQMIDHYVEGKVESDEDRDIPTGFDIPEHCACQQKQMHYK